MTKLSRTRKKPKGNGKPNSDPRDDVAKTGPGLTERTVRLCAKRADSCNGKTPYFRVEICASILRAPYPDVSGAFQEMVSIGAIEKANGGAYAPTPDFERACAAYLVQKEEARQAAQGSKRVH
jgi:hypothetical protein